MKDCTLEKSLISAKSVARVLCRHDICSFITEYTQESSLTSANSVASVLIEKGI